MGQGRTERAGAAGRREGERRCSCADDCENGCGRPCALQRHVPAGLRVRSESASDSVRLQMVGPSSCDVETGTRSANLHGQVQFSGVVDMPVVVQRLAPGSGQSRQLWTSTVALFWRWDGCRRGAAGGLSAFSRV